MTTRYVKMSGRLAFSQGAGFVQEKKADNVLVPSSWTHYHRVSVVDRVAGPTRQKLPGLGSEPRGAFFVINLEKEPDHIVYIGHGLHGPADLECWPGEFIQGLFYPDYDPFMWTDAGKKARLLVFFSNG